MSRRANALLAAMLLVPMVLLAACAEAVPGSGRLVGVSMTDEPSPTRPGPTQTGSPRPSGSAFSAVCPNIVDNEAMLSYRCIDDSLLVTLTPGYSLSVTSSTEPGWVAMQGSGPVVGLRGTSARQLAEQFTQRAGTSDYGTSPTSATRLEESVKLGRSAYRLDTMVTMDPDFLQDRGLEVKRELLSVTVIEIAQGEFSVLVLSLPDTVKKWWDGVEDVIAGVKVL